MTKDIKNKEDAKKQFIEYVDEMVNDFDGIPDKCIFFIADDKKISRRLHTGLLDLSMAIKTLLKDFPELLVILEVMKEEGKEKISPSFLEVILKNAIEDSFKLKGEVKIDTHIADKIKEDVEKHDNSKKKETIH